MRGILSYHIVSQVGYMVAAVGIGGAMGANGAAAHAFSNIFFKGLLFMAAGAVMYATGRSRLTRLGGLGRDLKWVRLLYMIGAFSIAGFPLFNGFITKSMVLAAAADGHYSTVFLLLNWAAVGTFLSVGLKLPFYAFSHREKPADIEIKRVPLNMYIGMGLVAMLCILHGIVPQLLYDLLPRAVTNFHPYTLLHVAEVVQMFTFVFMGFWLFRKTILKPKELILIDLDWFYRKPAALIRMLFVDGTVRIFDEVNGYFMRITRRLVQFGKNPLHYLLPGKMKEQEYSPDKYRPRVSLMVLGLLLVFILIVVVGIL
jgi:multicomponent Na+:H+ antiporter subunit D